jgi:hypothetical protein
MTSPFGCRALFAQSLTLSLDGGNGFLVRRRFYTTHSGLGGGSGISAAILNHAPFSIRNLFQKKYGPQRSALAARFEEKQEPSVPCPAGDS